MTKREVIQCVLAGGRPPYVPWSFGFTYEAQEKLLQHYGPVNLDEQMGNHLLSCGNS